jgi:hypothetical protein
LKVIERKRPWPDPNTVPGSSRRDLGVVWSIAVPPEYEARATLLSSCLALSRTGARITEGYGKYKQRLLEIEVNGKTFKIVPLLN